MHPYRLGSHHLRDLSAAPGLRGRRGDRDRGRDSGNVAGNDSLDGDVGTDECASDTGDAETGCEL